MSEFDRSKGKSRKRLLSLFGIALMLFASVGVYDGYQAGQTVRQQLRQQVQAYLACDGPQNKSGCNVHIPIQANLALSVTVTKGTGILACQNTTGCNRYLPHDLILNNFYNWLIILLDNAQSGQNLQTSIKDTTGASQTVNMWGTGTLATCASAGSVWPCTPAGSGGLIEVGTLSTAAARTDTNLGTPYQTYFDTSSACAASTTDSVVITGSENANAGATITESGLFYQGIVSNALKTYMLAHDVFGGVVVSGGNTITIQYTWSLNNAGFNYNLCELLAGYLTQPNGSGNQVKTPNSLIVFFDTVGRNVSWYETCDTGQFAAASAPLCALASSNPTSSAPAAWGAGDTVNTMQIAIGTGTAAFTPTSHALTAFYAQNFITSTSYDSAGNAYETANILLATGATISEAAIYLTLPKGCINYSPSGSGTCGSYTSDTIMLLAATFTGQAVPNGQSIGVTFQESG